MRRGVQKELRTTNFSEWIISFQEDNHCYLGKTIDLVRSMVMIFGLPKIITDWIKKSLVQYKG